MNRSGSAGKALAAEGVGFFMRAPVRLRFSRQTNWRKTPMSHSKAWPKIFAASRWRGTAARKEHDVDVAIKRAGDAGGAIRKPEQDAFWGGYSGYASDLDGHLWEVAVNPHFPLTDDGRLQLPD